MKFNKAIKEQLSMHVSGEEVYVSMSRGGMNTGADTRSRLGNLRQYE